jgi:hypothetical protein
MAPAAYGGSAQGINIKCWLEDISEHKMRNNPLYT